MMPMSYSAPPAYQQAVKLYKAKKGRAKVEAYRQEAARQSPPLAWEPWLHALFPAHFTVPMAPHHAELWEWVWALKKGVRPRPFILILAREGGKSTNAEAAAVAAGARQSRSYVWYVSETQDQADTKVTNIADLLEDPLTAAYYPELADREVGKYGTPRAWRRQRLRTRSEFIVDAVGLDTARRGAKVKEKRPDFMIFDDLDGKHDQPKTTRKKIETLTTSLLPAGSGDCAVLGVQNLILPEGIFAQLAGIARKPADFLLNRILSGPHPAIRDMAYERYIRQDGTFGYHITAGTPTWKGQSLAKCESLIDAWGIDAFLKEAQHEVKREAAGALWNRNLLEDTRVTTFPDLSRIAVAIDPPATVGQAGIAVGGIGRINGVVHGFFFQDASPPYGVDPAVWAKAGVAVYGVHHADVLIGEVNNGGKMVGHTIKSVEGGSRVNYQMVSASRSKEARAEPVMALFKENRIHLVGYFPELEDELCTWVPGTGESPNRLDALVWLFTELMITGGGWSRGMGK